MTLFKTAFSRSGFFSSFLQCLAILVIARGASGVPLQDSSPPPILTYTKILKGSFPEYVAISVDKSGAGTYDGRKVTDSPSPRPLRLSPRTTERMFELAGSMDFFSSIDLESHKNVANLGLKTFTYQDGDRTSKAQYNYTQRRDAQELADLFEKIATVEQHIAALEYQIKYDHLSLPKELLQIQIELNNKALADPQLMVPTLEQIARNPRFLHLAQERAQNILHALQQTSN